MSAAESKLNGLNSDLKKKQDDLQTAYGAVFSYQSYAELPGANADQRAYYLRAVEHYKNVAVKILHEIVNLQTQITAAQTALDDAKKKLADCLERNKPWGFSSRNYFKF